MSYAFDLFVGGEFTKDELAQVLQPNFAREFERVSEYNDRYCWGLTYDDRFTAIGDNVFTSEWFDPTRYPILITFYDLRLDGAELEAWIEQTWQTWLPWLIPAGASRVLMVRDFGPPLRHWRLPSPDGDDGLEGPFFVPEPEGWG